MGIYIYVWLLRNFPDFLKALFYTTCSVDYALFSTLKILHDNIYSMLGKIPLINRFHKIYSNLKVNPIIMQAK